ncbi:MAG: hypothetical protein KKG33_13020 [candidate division Zixibacteria bacterium]|nr:hypothetical protein [candidate division Zixibacteria bacterium]MBU1471081.1 hypothetical protein [candidate division Zixibacteria bacterium]MBU2626475.1 hypothetical protein [candidate division Zixibacteria bacterium]
MHKSLILALALLIAAVMFYGCSDGISGRKGVNKILAGDTLSLSLGETAYRESDHLRINFESVPLESRCPTRVQCFWAGIASASIELTKSGLGTASASPSISGGGFNPRLMGMLSDTALGYRVDLLSLIPYPEWPGPIEQKQYVATLRISDYEYPDIDTTVIITDLPPEMIQLDPFTLGYVSVASDTLSITLSYGGGCGSHDFLLFMSPDAFLESYPVQANLYLRHDDHDDACDAWITETRRFILTPVRDRFNQMYDSGDSIVLNVFEYSEYTPQSHRHAVYTF